LGVVGVNAEGRDKEAQLALEERIDELAEAFMLLITATGFLEVCLSLLARGLAMGCLADLTAV
jgi:hypothetical protein